MKNWRWLVGVVLGLLLTLSCSLASRLVPAPAPTAVPTQSATERQLAVFDAVFKEVRDRYVRSDYGGVDWNAIGAQYRTQVAAGLTDDVFAQTLRAMLAKLPSNAASYQTRAERVLADTSTQATYFGIGAFIAFRKTPQPHVVILGIVSNSPAEAAGLLPHDSLYAVDGVPFTLSDEQAPSQRIRAQTATTVTLTVQTPGQPPRPLTLQRAQIQASDALRGGNLPSLNVAYYRLPVFADSTLPATLAGNLATLSQTTRLNGIVLDLRVAASDPSGWPFNDMLTLFGNGPMGEFYTRTGSIPLSVTGQDAGGSQTVPLVILVGPDTAGSPEIFAAALQASKRAVVVGEPTTGGVQGFDDLTLSDGSRLLLATQAYRTTNQLDLGQSGVTPNDVVARDWDSYTEANDPVILEALNLLPAH